ncbi:MAG TPA: hypothetical protein VMZ90_01645 [Vicinamibacterales bacterium]|nr:hypothetical protein [Vicinamibacterales bacterium]
MKRASVLLLLFLVPLQPTVPQRLTDAEFWSIVTDASEPGGTFRSLDITNLTSNETLFQHVIPGLLARTKPGGAYLGVGPEQNFTYIAAVRPRIVIIFDVRRGNLATQLMYKALFELSPDRATFVSMLFSKPKPPGLSAGATADALFEAFGQSPTSDQLFRKNLAALIAHLTKTHSLPLGAGDLGAIQTIYQTFYNSGFSVRSSPTYWDLMAATDAGGAERSYLSSEKAFAVLKDLESRNLIIPVVGDFGGPKALRWVASYLRTRRAIVSAFYLSNVEQYLMQDGKWQAFCANVAAMPIDATSTFIRSSSGGRGFGRGGGFVSSLGGIAEEVKSCGVGPG